MTINLSLDHLLLNDLNVSREGGKGNGGEKSSKEAIHRDAFCLDGRQRLYHDSRAQGDLSASKEVGGIEGKKGICGV